MMSQRRRHDVDEDLKCNIDDPEDLKCNIYDPEDLECSGYRFRESFCPRSPGFRQKLFILVSGLCFIMALMQLGRMNWSQRDVLQAQVDRLEERETKILQLLTDLQTNLGQMQGIKHPAHRDAVEPQAPNVGGATTARYDPPTARLSTPMPTPKAAMPTQSAAMPTQSATIPQKASSHAEEPSLGKARKAPEETPPTDTTDIPAYLQKTQWPAEWLKNFSSDTLARSALEAVAWRTKTLNAMSHSWAGYSKVYGADTVNPLYGMPGKRWANAAFTLVDSLSTLWLMEMHDEFDKAAEWIDSNLHFDYKGYVSVFELIIRDLAGLLSAYALSKNPVFKRKAQELGNAIMPAFEYTLPATQISLGRGIAKNGWFKGVLLAEAGTIQLEFRYLSEITGDPKFKEKGDAAMDMLLDYGGDRGLVPVGWAGRSAHPGPISKHITFGATGDSYYEYLLKLWIQSGKKEHRYLNAWMLSMQQMNDRLVRKSETYAVVLEEASPGRIIPKMDHLACFVGGMLALGERSTEDTTKGYMELGKQITAACFDMYRRTETGLAPEIFAWRKDAAEPNNLSVKNDAAYYLLRPETAESIFYLFYYTGDPKYRRWAGHIIDAIEEQTKGPFGYCAIKDVRVSPAKKKAEMESFFLAETLKYLYLTFVTVPKEVLDLDKFVLNTEAHPLPILGQ